jgi:hypothetical protein
MPADSRFTLQIRLEGPLVADNRLPLSELLRIGAQLRDVLRDVAVVLTDLGPSGTSGRSQRVVEQAVDLQVVAGPRAGSFLLELELPPESPPAQEQLELETGPALSERTVIATIDGLEALNDGVEQLPEGFDRGVLKAVVPLGTALRRGLTSIQLTADTAERRHATEVTPAKVDVVERLITKAIKAHAVAQGVLEMVDFRRLEFRIDRPPQPSVTVFFEERDRETVHAAIRQFVRVVGQGQFEPEQSEPSKIWAARIEVLYESLQFDPEAFWHERGLEQLAAEQNVAEYIPPADFESDPWRDDDAAARLIEAIHRGA